MTSFLLFVPVEAEQSRLAENLVRSAECFFEAQGAAVKRVELGSYNRAGRGNALDLLNLVALTVDGKASAVEPVQHARALEGVLRSTLVAAGARSAEVRVFVACE
jgi:hypothetical protein